MLSRYIVRVDLGFREPPANTHSRCHYDQQPSRLQRRYQVEPEDSIGPDARPAHGPLAVWSSTWFAQHRDLALTRLLARYVYVDRGAKRDSAGHIDAAALFGEKPPKGRHHVRFDKIVQRYFGLFFLSASSALSQHQIQPPERLTSLPLVEID